MENPVLLSSPAESQSWTFPQFKEFPLEIRQLIWEAALPGPRIVTFELDIPHDGRCHRVRSDVDVNSSSNDDFFDFDLDLRYHQIYPMTPLYKRAKITGPVRSHVPKFHAKVPIITSVCRESRAVAERCYALGFGSSISPPRVWFSFERDTLHMSERVISGFERDDYSVTDLGPDLTMVKHISIAESYLDDINLSEDGPRRHLVPHSWCSRTISWFSSLESVTYTINPNYHSFKGDLIFNEVQNIATAFDQLEEIEDDLWSCPFARPGRQVKATNPLPDGWEKVVLEALKSEFAGRARQGNSSEEIVPKVEGLKINRMALSTAQDPDMSRKVEAIVKELERFYDNLEP